MKWGGGKGETCMAVKKRRYNNLVYVVKEIIFRFPFSKEWGDDDVVIRHGYVCRDEAA